MMISIEDDDREPRPVDEEEFAELDVLERDHIEEWAIQQPQLLGEELLIFTSEFGDFEDIYDRLDILSLDPTGKPSSQG